MRNPPCTLLTSAIDCLFSRFTLLNSLFVLVLVICAAAWCLCAKRIPAFGRLTGKVEIPGHTVSPARGTEFLLIEKDVSVLFMLAQAGTFSSEREVIFKAFRRTLEDSVISRCDADQQGRLSFREVPPGSYWVVNPDPVPWNGDTRIIWACPLTLTIDKPYSRLRLQWSNAALIISD